MQGDFTEGLAIVPEVEEKLKEYALFVDSHRILVFNYKIASLYFGAGDYNEPQSIICIKLSTIISRDCATTCNVMQG